MQGKKIKATLSKAGVAKVKLPKFKKVGKRKVKVALKGNAQVKRATKTVKVKVRR
ncbi:hypothetical protein [Nocardioides alcanivorans]|uniref:hypothetical protein n=1 Tax=Nocardioides alcanivorans TaxID=2897352 RepID=UPI001F3E8247|nr:hypothetical protein [Nocardioides alcanivorans]